MSRELRQVAAAFGSGDWTAARQKAEQLLAQSQDERVVALAKEYLIRLPSEQRGVDGASQSKSGIEETAVTRLASAYRHQLAGQFPAAHSEYLGIIEGYPGSGEAQRAAKQLTNLLWGAGAADEAEALCRRMCDAGPDSALGVAACQALFQMTAFHANPASFERTRGILRDISEHHPGTAVDAAAQFGSGYLYAWDGIPEVAERIWTKLVQGSAGPENGSVCAARAELARVRYERALHLDSRGDRLGSVNTMRMVVNAPGWEGSRLQPLSLYALWCQDLASHGDPSWWEGAVGAYRELGQITWGTEASLLYRLRAGLCLQGGGRHTEAILELRSLLAETSNSEQLRAQVQSSIRISEEALAEARNAGEQPR